jgi:hypothetical protein
MTSGSTVHLTLLCQAYHTQNTLTLQILDDGHSVCCSHCGHPLGRLEDLLHRARRFQPEASAA